MRQQSEKARKVASERRSLAMRMGPTTCMRCSAAAAADLHEPLCRSRGGNPADPAQCVPLCRPCHDWVHANPLEATKDGWLISRYGRETDDDEERDEERAD